MNEELQNQLSTILQGVINTADSASAFFIEELPEVIQQLLMWKFAVSLITTLIFPVFASTLALYVYKRGYKNFTEWIRLMNLPYSQMETGDNSKIVVKGVETIGGGAISLIALLVSSHHLNLTWLQIWLAPKIYLMEYASTLIK
jgi:predicted nuclease of restriction endonuclease-like RecB superfamily